MPARLFSHRCTQKRDGVYHVNEIKSCIFSLKNGYEGIEVDFNYKNGLFYMHHDDYRLTNETMDMLFTAMSNMSYSIWIDLKTSTSINGQLEDLYFLLEKHDMLYRHVVEIYNTSLIVPNGMKTTSCYFPYNGDILCKKAKQINVQDMFNPKAIYVWDETSSNQPCMLHGLNKKDVIIQAYNLPRPYVCYATYPIVWIALCLLIISVISLAKR